MQDNEHDDQALQSLHFPLIYKPKVVLTFGYTEYRIETRFTGHGAIWHIWASDFTPSQSCSSANLPSDCRQFLDRDRIPCPQETLQGPHDSQGDQCTSTKSDDFILDPFDLKACIIPTTSTLNVLLTEPSKFWALQEYSPVWCLLAVIVRMCCPSEDTNMLLSFSGTRMLPFWKHVGILNLV